MVNLVGRMAIAALSILLLVSLRSLSSAAVSEFESVAVFPDVGYSLEPEPVRGRGILFLSSRSRFGLNAFEKWSTPCESVEIPSEVPGDGCATVRHESDFVSGWRGLCRRPPFRRVQSSLRFGRHFRSTGIYVSPLVFGMGWRRAPFYEFQDFDIVFSGGVRPYHPVAGVGRRPGSRCPSGLSRRWRGFLPS